MSGLGRRLGWAFLPPRQLLFRAPQVRLWSEGDKGLAGSAPPSVWTPGEGGGPMGAARSAAVWAPVAWSGTGRRVGTGCPTGERAQLPACGGPRPPPTHRLCLPRPPAPRLGPPAQLAQPKPGACVQRLFPPWPDLCPDLQTTIPLARGCAHSHSSPTRTQTGGRPPSPEGGIRAPTPARSLQTCPEQKPSGASNSAESRPSRGP